MGGLQIIGYLSVLFFVLTVILKMVKIAGMPAHLRWDLYPIPHEKGKGEYGGSYFEELNWWTKPKEFSLVNEVKEMAREIIFIQSLFRHNRSLWIFSFPFHIGMYLLIVFVILLLIGAVFGISNTPHGGSSSVAAQIINGLTVVIGTLGWILAIIGALGLLLSRIFSRKLRAATVISDYANLLILLAVFVSGFVAWLTADPKYTELRAYLGNMITLTEAGTLPVAVTTQLWLTFILLIYFPFTHMTHMFGKYFTYHKVRWEDKPNIRGSKLENAIQNVLGYKLDWAAPHIKTGATWAEAVTEKTGTDEQK